MRGENTVNIIESILTKNDCYKKAQKITVKGLVLHSVGINQPSAAVFVKNFNVPNLEVCTHGFIDANTGDVYKTLPFNINGWHVGGSANKTHLGFEMCEPSQIKYTTGANFTISAANLPAAQKACTTAYNSAVELFANLCKQFNLDPLKDGVIISHSEAYKRGVGSNHADPEHLWKGLKMPYTMNGFRKDVKTAMDKAAEPKKLYKVQIGAFSDKKNAEDYKKLAEQKGFKAIIVESTVK